MDYYFWQLLRAILATIAYIWLAVTYVIGLVIFIIEISFHKIITDVGNLLIRSEVALLKQIHKEEVE